MGNTSLILRIAAAVYQTESSVYAVFGWMGKRKLFPVCHPLRYTVSLERINAGSGLVPSFLVNLTKLATT